MLIPKMKATGIVELVKAARHRSLYLKVVSASSLTRVVKGIIETSAWSVQDRFMLS
jgi:hypothetical protein